ncbi:hypothetical protein IJM86_04600 [bacterium]|nr:hypothetical protein [bacterium]
MTKNLKIDIISVFITTINIINMITVLTNPLSPPSTPDEKNFPKRKGIRMKLQAALQNWISKNPTNNKKIDIPG